MKFAHNTYLCWGLILALIVTFPGIFLAIILAVSAETFASRAFAVSLLAFYVATILLMFVIRTFRASLLVSTLIMYGLALVGFINCFLLVPSGQITQASQFQSVFPSPRTYVRWSPANLVREIDQMKLGAFVMPYLDPSIDFQKGRRLRDLFLMVYREMQTDPEFVEVGSVMHHAYAELAGFPFDTRHLYVYIPHQTSQEKLPCKRLLAHTLFIRRHVPPLGRDNSAVIRGLHD